MSDLVGNPKDRFSCYEAQILLISECLFKKKSRYIIIKILFKADGCADRLKPESQVFAWHVSILHMECNIAMP